MKGKLSLAQKCMLSELPDLFDVGAYLSSMQNLVQTTPDCELAEIIREELDKLQIAFVEMKRLSNRRLPVLKLPYEIMGRIFETLQSEDESDQYRWIRITWVCDDWRQAAIGCASLWMAIPTNHKSDEWVAIILQRSKGAPISIQHQFPIQTNLPLSRLETILTHNFHRLERLKFTDVSHCCDTQSLFSCFPASAPLLRHLQLETCACNDEYIPNVFRTALQKIPSLETLSLHRCHLPWTKCTFSNLSSLSISYPPHRSSVEDVLIALESMPLLRTIYFEGVFRHPPCITAAARRRTGHIALPRLASVDLWECNLLSSIYLLDSIVCPGGYHLKGRLIVPEEDGAPSEYSRLSTVVASALHCTAITTLKLWDDAGGSAFYFATPSPRPSVIGGSHGTGGLVDLEFPDPGPQSGPPLSAALLRVPLAQLTCLELNDAYVSQMRMVETFGRLEGLVSIKLGHCSARAFLLGASMHPGSFAALTSLSLHHVKFSCPRSETFASWPRMEELTHFLGMRETKLARLSLHHCMLQSPEVYPRALMYSLVDDIDFGDVEGCRSPYNFNVSSDL